MKKTLGEAQWRLSAEGMSEMRFDLSGCGAGLDESAGSLLQLGPWAESLGYDGLWLNEEHFGLLIPAQAAHHNEMMPPAVTE